jgi:hypothetical protein
VLFWAVGVIPAAVVTAVRGHWLLFWGGWLTVGILWFVGALTPYPDGRPDGAPYDPRWLLAPIAVVATMMVLGVFGARPAPLLGLGGKALQRSVGNGNLLGGKDACERATAGAWRCQRWDDGFSGTVSYRVKADWKGCWHATRVGPAGEGSPKQLSGCVSLVDYVF